MSEMLGLLLQDARYNIVFLDESAGGKLGELLANVQLLILAPPRDLERRKAFLGIEANRQAMGKIPVLELLRVPQNGARSGLGRSVNWPCRIGNLEREIEAALLAGPQAGVELGG